jgi:hypothetical protein
VGKLRNSGAFIVIIMLFSVYYFMFFVCTGFWWENLRKRDYLRDLGLDERISLKRIFRKWDMGVWTGLRWLRIERGGGNL